MVIIPQFPDFTLNVVGENIYMIRAKGNSNMFIHRIPQLCTAHQFAWVLKQGEFGGELFTKNQIDNFFASYRGTNLEPVKLAKVLGNDHSMN